MDVRGKFSSIKNSFMSDNLIQNIVVASSGSVLAQIINVLTQPIITRIYSPEEYGVFSLFTSILLIFRISTLRYETAIPIPRKKVDAFHLLVNSIISVTLFVFIFTMIFYFSGMEILSVLDAEGLYPYWIFIPLGVFIQGIYLSLQGWMHREKEFKLISLKDISQTLGGSISKIILGQLNTGTLGLLISQIFSLFIATIIFIVKFIKSNLNFYNAISWRKLKNNAIKYKSYPLYQTPSSLSLHLRNQLPILFIAPLYGPEIAGYFGLANQIIKLPMSLLGKSVMDVFFAEVASLGRNKPHEIKKISDSLFKKLFSLGLIPFIVLFFFSPHIFRLLFGVEWTNAGYFASILSIYVFANFIFSPVSRIFEVFRKQNTKLLIDILSLILLSLIFIVAGFLDLNIYVLIGIYSLAMFLVYFITYLISNHILQMEIEKNN